MLDRDLLDILVCPKCKGPLEHKVGGEEGGTATEELVCHACALRYEVRDDIPIMLIDEAKPL